MVQHLSAAGVAVPDGFATTAEAYRRFLGETGLADRINALLADLDVDDVRRLAEVGQQIRASVEDQAFPRTSKPISGPRTRSSSAVPERR